LLKILKSSVRESLRVPKSTRSSMKGKKKKHWRIKRVMKGKHKETRKKDH
jgi:hypothetical protein